MNREIAEQKRVDKGIHDFALLFLLFCSLSLNVYLASHQKFNLSRIEHSREPASTVSIGTRISSVNVKALDGKDANLQFQGAPRPAIVYYFSPTCTWCERNLKGIRLIANETRNSYAFYGISLSNSGLADYARQKSLPFAVYSVDKQIGLPILPSGTPTTIVIDRTGTVVEEWEGAFLNSNKAAVEQYFGLQLPDIPEAE